MRNLKFRVWDKENNCWANIRHLLIEQCSLPRMDGYFGFSDIFQADYPDSELIYQQFTGLKDKHNVDIYEGDIVEYSLDGNVFQDKVVFENFGWYLVNLQVSGSSFPLTNGLEYRIIENIFEDLEPVK